MNSSVQEPGFKTPGESIQADQTQAGRVSAGKAPFLSAVIPAAGMSTRMHRYKPLLKFGIHTMVEQVISLFQQIRIDDIIVVTGHNSDLLAPLIDKAGARQVFNPNFKTGMLGSIQRGISKISPDSKGFFLLPVDIPVIRPSSIATLVAAFEDNPEKIIIPEFDQEPGHPPLIPSWLIPAILDLDSNSNLGKLLLSRQEHQKRQIVHDCGILMDADTQEAYELVKKKYQKQNIPDGRECRSIIKAMLKGKENIKAHLELVAKTALTLARAVRAGSDPSGPSLELDMDLIRAGALLHDIQRTQKNHAALGAQFLLSLGFFEVADLVAQHMDLALPLSARLTETQLVYFADKLCHGTSLEFDYSKRFNEKILKAPHAKSQIQTRHEHTRQIQTRIQEVSGRSVESILR